MSKKVRPAAEAPEVKDALPPSNSRWTPEELMEVKHLGPGVIGKEMFEAAQAYNASSNNGTLGPATRGES